MFTFNSIFVLSVANNITDCTSMYLLPVKKAAVGSMSPRRSIVSPNVYTAASANEPNR